MPELNPFKKEFLKEVSNQKGEFDTRERMIKFIENSNVKKLGSGSECIVIEHPTNKGKVVAINYENLKPLKAKDIYYSSKICNTLFPYNFPKIYSASAKENEDEFNGTIKEKVAGRIIAHGDEKEGSPHPFSNIKKEIALLKQDPYNLPIEFDGNLGNFFEAKNSTFYVDTLSMGSTIKYYQEQGKTINTEEIVKYMNEKKYKESDIKTVISSIERLKELYKDQIQK